MVITAETGVKGKRKRERRVEGREEDRKSQRGTQGGTGTEFEDGECTQSAFRANVLMHWNSLLESATTALVIGTLPLAS